MNLLHRIGGVVQAGPQRAAVLEEGSATSYGELLAVATAGGRLISQATQAEPRDSPVESDIESRHEH